LWVVLEIPERFWRFLESPGGDREGDTNHSNVAALTAKRKI
jgi:hypothetical protein